MINRTDNAPTQVLEVISILASGRMVKRMDKAFRHLSMKASLRTVILTGKVQLHNFQFKSMQVGPRIMQRMDMALRHLLIVKHMKES